MSLTEIEVVETLTLYEVSVYLLSQATVAVEEVKSDTTNVAGNGFTQAFGSLIIVTVHSWVLSSSAVTV